MVSGFLLLLVLSVLLAFALTGHDLGPLGGCSVWKGTVSAVYGPTGPLSPRLESVTCVNRAPNWGKQIRKVQRFPDMEAHVFLSRYGRPYREFPRDAWHGALGRAGLEGRGLQGPHSLRRTFATEYQGEDRDLKELLGHADLSTTLLYRRFKPSRAREAVLALDFKPARRRKAQ